MKLIVDIPKETYKKCKWKNNGVVGLELWERAIANGTLIPDNEPMQVELEGDGYADGELVYDYGKCPKCGWEFEEGDKDWEEPYCCHCGQRLDWFYEEGETNEDTD